MSLQAIAALFIAMAVLAAVPSVSVLAVVARAAAGGFRHGALTAAGIVAGDLLFVLIAIFGLALIAESAGPYFKGVLLLGGGYLIWSGTMLLRTASTTANVRSFGALSPLTSFMAGLLITLADQKAIFFYLGFFPAFVDLATLGYRDTAIILSITVVAVGGVKLVYAGIAAQSGQRFTNPRLSRWVKRIAGLILIAIGGVLLLRIAQ